MDTSPLGRTAIEEIRGRFDQDFKEGAVRLVRETGRPIAQVARDLGINEGTLDNWVNADRRSRAEGNGVLSEDERAELARPTEQPVQASELAIHSSELPVQPSELPTQSSVRRLFTTFGYLVAKQGATAVLGLAYLAVATHLFSARDVGLAAAASSTAFFLGAVGALGIPLLLLAELDSLPAAVRRVTFSTGMYISCLAVLILSLATLALSPFLGNSLRIIGANSTTAALFVIGSVATMGTFTFDNVAIGLHRGSVQLWRGSLTSVLKLAIVGVLVLVGTRTAPGLLFAWALSLVVSFVFFPMLRLEPTRPAKGTSAIGWHSPAATACSPSSTTSLICRSIPSSTSSE
ncbi:transposase [Trebonia sp.]|uniref:transposase n=1 Tax=Trebonia sp. TaxID=2767075 RepID=UPI003CC56991